MRTAKQYAEVTRPTCALKSSIAPSVGVVSQLHNTTANPQGRDESGEIGWRDEE